MFPSIVFGAVASSVAGRKKAVSGEKIVSGEHYRFPANRFVPATSVFLPATNVASVNKSVAENSTVFPGSVVGAVASSIPGE